jgi:hypothetical protein
MVFSYNRLNGLLNILEQALINNNLLSRIIIITNGDYPSRLEIEKFPKDMELILIAKKGGFDSSVLFFYDIAKNWDGYTYICGDDDLPNFKMLHFVVNEGLKLLNVQELPSIIGFNPPTKASPGLINCTGEEFEDKLKEMVNKPISYNEILMNFIFSLPLGSFLLLNEEIKSCQREILNDSIGTWHTYSILAYQMAFEKNKNAATAKPFIWIYTEPSVLLPQNRIWNKTYKLDADMRESLMRSFDYINLSLLSEDERVLFKKITKIEINNWIKE